MFEIVSSASLNSVFCISSLEEDKQGTTRRFKEDLESFLESKGVYFENARPLCKNELFETLGHIESDARHGMRPIIHIDTHGEKNDGILIARTNEFIPWIDLSDRFRAINTSTGNNLCIVSAACFSYNTLLGLDIDQLTPFYLMIAPASEVTFGFTEDNMVRFYYDLLTKLDIVTAYANNLSQKFSLYHSEQFFANLMAQYFRYGCIGKGFGERRERLLTVAVNNGMTNTRHNRRMLRKSAKAMLRPRQDVLDKYAGVFLGPRSVSYDLKDIMSLIERPQRTRSRR